jgi:pimeloyl-ACP methyl ester carboxylesterase
MGEARPCPRRLVFAALAAAVAASIAAMLPSAGAAARKPLVRTWTVHYLDANGKRRAAYVLLPAWYRPGFHPAIPLIISPHGRGLTGRDNARLWGGLPAVGPFAVVNPDGLSPYSWGASGQIDDLARMPEILRRTLPWLSIDRRQIYAFGGSMGGQETLLLLARHPGLLAGAAAFDSVTDFARQFRNFGRLPCDRACRRDGPIGRRLQKLARRTVGGTPATASYAFRLRSPLTYARRIAFSCVPLQLWWSVADQIVRDQDRQSGQLFWQLRKLNPEAPVQAFVGNWMHSSEMRASAQLPLALAAFGLVGPRDTRPPGLHSVPAPAADCVPAA